MEKTRKSGSEIYARMALSQIPRILTLQDRNPLSKTYGSFSRTYWLDRTTDFSNALSQYATHALALSWAHEMPDNPYYRQAKILQYVKAGMEHWISCQHDDGSFDEFYPQERGWAGPTGFLVYAMADSYLRIKDELETDLASRLLEAIRKGGEFLGSYDEIGTLANHYVMAALAIRYAHQVTQDDSLLRCYRTVLDQTLSLFDLEGWGLEYDGADIGYLSASVSFFSKISLIEPDERIYDVVKRAIEFSSYFVYPDGHFAGTLGSRNTLHFYPHGYELLANSNPLAGRIADAMIDGLASGALVPPQIMADRYFLYRVPEFLLSYIDHLPRKQYDSHLPCEGEDFETYFPHGRFYASKKGKTYCVINAGKGGVIKVFDTKSKRLIYGDTGILLESNKRVLSSQWVDANYAVTHVFGQVNIEGQFHRLPGKLFSPFKAVLFRLFLICFAWNTALSYRLKGWIRSALMLVHKKEKTRFRRVIDFENDTLTVTDEVQLEPGKKIRKAFFGDDIPVRYVPQSRYFQPHELFELGFWATPEELAYLNKGGLSHSRIIDCKTGDVSVKSRGNKGRSGE